jgi:hypothetical protein
VADTKFVGTGSGEQPGTRQAMDAVTRDLVKGGMKPRDAEKKARELALDWDRRNGR